MIRLYWVLCVDDERLRKGGIVFDLKDDLDKLIDN